MPQGYGIHKNIQYLSEIFLAVPELHRLVKTVFVTLLYLALEKQGIQTQEQS